MSRLHSYITPDVFITLTVSFAVTCCIPLLFLGVVKDSETMSAEYGYSLVTKASLIAVALSAPLLFDAVLGGTLPRVITLSRWVHILALTAPNITIFLSNSFQIASCMSAMRDLLITGALMSLMFSGYHFFTPPRKLFYLLILFISVVHNNVGLWSALCECFPNVYLTVVRILFIISLSGLLVIIIKVIFHPGVISAIHLSACESLSPYYSMLVIISLFFKTLIRFFSIGIMGSEFEMYHSNQCIAGFIIIDAAQSTFAAAISSRIARKDRDISQLLVSSKRRFLCYIAEEFRRSLDAIVAAADSAQQDIKKRRISPFIPSDPVFRVFYDVKGGCEMAYALLENVTLADEIENGVMEFKHSLISALALITGAIIPVERKANQAGVGLLYGESSHLSPELSSVFIEADVRLLKQAIRNLLMIAVGLSRPGDQLSVFSFMKRKSGKSTPEQGGHALYEIEGDGLAKSEQCGLLRVEIHMTGQLLGVINQNSISCRSSEWSTNTIMWVTKCIVHMHSGSVGVVHGTDLGCAFYLEVPAISNSEQVIDLAPDDSDMCTPEPFTCAFEGKQCSHDTELRKINRALVVSNINSEVSFVTTVLRDLVEDVIISESAARAVNAVQTALYTMRSIHIVFVSCHLVDNGASSLLPRMRNMGYMGMVVLLCENTDGGCNHYEGEQYVIHTPLDIFRIQQCVSGDILAETL